MDSWIHLWVLSHCFQAAIAFGASSAQVSGYSPTGVSPSPASGGSLYGALNNQGTLANYPPPSFGTRRTSATTTYGSIQDVVDDEEDDEEDDNPF